MSGKLGPSAIEWFGLMGQREQQPHAKGTTTAFCNVTIKASLRLLTTHHGEQIRIYKYAQRTAVSAVPHVRAERGHAVRGLERRFFMASKFANAIAIATKGHSSLAHTQR